MEKEMDLESINLKTEINMKVNGRIIWNMDKENFIMLMVSFMKDNGRIIKKKV